jgi:hypothetical protein
MRFQQTAREYLAGIEYRLQRAKYAFRGGTFSHSREQEMVWGFIEELLPTNIPRFAIDIGAGNGIRWSNTYSLFLSGWQGFGVEADERKFVQLVRAYRDLPGVKACHSQIGPENAISILKQFQTPKDFGLLSLDIDGNDYWVLRTLLRQFRPALVITEINEKVPPPLRFVVRPEPNFKLRHHFYGYSMAALADLCELNRYGILALEYNNAFLAPMELGHGRFVDALTAYRDGYRDRVDRKERFATNLDVEPVLSMSSSEALKFLDHFYAEEPGKYYLTDDKRAFEALVQQDLGLDKKSGCEN